MAAEKAVAQRLKCGTLAKKPGTDAGFFREVFGGDSLYREHGDLFSGLVDSRG
jgi:hypothetical protein